LLGQRAIEINGTIINDRLPADQIHGLFTLQDQDVLFLILLSAADEHRAPDVWARLIKYSFPLNAGLSKSAVST
jgi:hypothetical protein